MSDVIHPNPIKYSWLLGTLVAFSLFAVIAIYSSRMSWHYVDYDQKRAIARYETLKKLQADENALLTPVDAKGNPTAEWIDQAKGVVRIPIDEAMAEEVETLKAKPAQIGSPLPVTAPAPPAPAVMPATTAQPAGGTSSAAPAKSEATPPAAKTPAPPTAKKPVKPAPSSPKGSDVPATSPSPVPSGTPPQPNP